jgi:Domain of unknown function (DUF4410)
MRRLAILLALAVAACTPGHVQTTQRAATGTLPAPAHVVVTDFTLKPEQVKLDTGVAPQFLAAATGEPASAREMQAARATQAALAETLTARLASYGLPAQRLPADATPPPNTLLVQGQIGAVNEGNRTRRTLIGLGAGKSSIAANAQLYYITDPAQPRFVQSLGGTADSGHKPGAAETLGAGAAADRLATSSAVTAATHGAQARRTDDEANADRLAEALAREIGAYAVSQGWIPASAIQ